MNRPRGLLLAPALVGLALLAAACGGSPGSHVARLGSTATQSSSSSNLPAAPAQVDGALAFSRCIRSNGVPSYPDPSSSGVLAKELPRQLGVSTSQFQSAQSACVHLLPNGGSGPTPAELQQSWSEFRSFARCMRSHGVSNWPDPTRYPQHPERPTFELQVVGIDQSSPQILPEIHRCLPLLDGNNPQRLGEGGS